MRSMWVRAILILLGIWACAGLVILATRAARPTPESVAAYIQNHPLEGLSPDRRAEIIARAAKQLNRLDFEQRQALRAQRADRTFFEQMTPSERRAFLEATLPEGFRQLMLALNKMEPNERKRIVQRALNDLEKESPEISNQIDDEDAQKLITEGLGAFYEEASAEVKLEFAPVLEKLQRFTQGLR